MLENFNKCSHTPSTFAYRIVWRWISFGRSLLPNVLENALSNRQLTLQLFEAHKCSWSYVDFSMVLDTFFVLFSDWICGNFSQPNILTSIVLDCKNFIRGCFMSKRWDFKLIRKRWCVFYRISWWTQKYRDL